MYIKKKQNELQFGTEDEVTVTKELPYSVARQQRLELEGLLPP